jgi:uracil-DNA glycosylase
MILFVGDKPSPKMKPGAKPFEGAACEARLKAWIKELGLTLNNYERNSCCIINQIDLARSELLVTVCKPYIVALGNNASKALGKIPHFKLPHPSGRNRQINDKSYIEARLAECKKYIESFAKV